MDEKLSLLIVEDSLPTRKRIEAAITEVNRFKLIASVDNYHDAVEVLQKQSPNILLTDLDLPDGNGLDLIKLVSTEEINTQLSIVISVFCDAEHVVKALKAGASGYLLKDDTFMEINDAISQMVAGGAPISPSIARFLLAELNLDTPQPESPTIKLSKRENEVLLLISKGYTVKEIASLLSLSPFTIKDYIKTLYKKLAVNNKLQAVNEARLNGII